MRNLAFLMVPILFLLDRASKIWANNVLRLMPGGAMELIPGVLRLQFAENTGAAFSLFAGNTWVLVWMTGLVMLAMLGYLIFGKNQHRLVRWSLMMILAGGLGNLYDRIVHRCVIDYAEFVFVRFAIFNVADVFVCAGAVLCATGVILAEREGKRRAVDDSGRV